MNHDIMQGKWIQTKSLVQMFCCTIVGDQHGVIAARRTKKAGERQCAYGVVRSLSLRDATATHVVAN